MENRENHYRKTDKIEIALLVFTHEPSFVSYKPAALFLTAEVYSSPKFDLLDFVNDKNLFRYKE